MAMQVPRDFRRVIVAASVGNVIWSFAGAGVQLDGAGAGNTVAGNVIGLTPAGVPTPSDGSGVGGPPPGSSQIGGWNLQTSVGANRPPQVRPNGTRKPSKKYAVGVRRGPPRRHGPLAARSAQPWLARCHFGKRDSTLLKSRK